MAQTDKYGTYTIINGRNQYTVVNDLEIDDDTHTKIIDSICKMAQCNILINVGATSPNIDSIKDWIKTCTREIMQMLINVVPEKYEDLKKAVIILQCYEESCMKTGFLTENQKYGLYIDNMLQFKGPLSEIHLSYNIPRYKSAKKEFKTTYDGQQAIYANKYIAENQPYMDKIKAKIQTYDEANVSQKEFLKTVLGTITDVIKDYKSQNDNIPQIKFELSEDDNNNIYPINIKQKCSQTTAKYTWCDKENEYLLLFIYAIAVTKFSFKEIWILKRSSTRDAFYTTMKKQITTKFFGEITEETRPNDIEIERVEVVSSCSDIICAVGSLICSCITSGGTRKKTKNNTKNKKQRTMKQKTRHKKKYKYKCMQRQL